MERMHDLYDVVHWLTCESRRKVEPDQVSSVGSGAKGASKTIMSLLVPPNA